MGRAGDEIRNPTAMQQAINDELQAAARKLSATRTELQSLDAWHPQAAFETLQSLGAKPDLLEIVGRIGYDCSDDWVLEELHRWNTENP